MSTEDETVEFSNPRSRDDADGSGVMDYSEFVAAVMSKEIYADDAILFNAFKVFDVEGGGTVSMEELKKIFGEDPSMGIGKSEIDAVVAQIDINGDGEIIM